jgi:hypothetical protein
MVLIKIFHPPFLFVCRCCLEKFLQLGFVGVLDIYQRVLFKKSHNGHFFNITAKNTKYRSYPRYPTFFSKKQKT